MNSPLPPQEHPQAESEEGTRISAADRPAAPLPSGESLVKTVSRTAAPAAPAAPVAPEAAPAMEESPPEPAPALTDVAAAPESEPPVASQPQPVLSQPIPVLPTPQAPAPVKKLQESPQVSITQRASQLQSENKRVRDELDALERALKNTTT